MITAVPLFIYAELLMHYHEKWSSDQIDEKYERWEKDQQMRQDLGYDEQNFKIIPKRKIRNNAARRKHGY